ncbi:polysaccharide biosynthesis/export family protein [Mucilaginibacter sp. SP1R1]|uniref:polysaccharide biosynthesis/export family protein n=1 Tax=Mucilaginibacter sp. SP1R1 TaxID=2723091 RepID=UPI00160CEFF1|nr:polysaccharide biosynthesis/export family protein [Mucilaginibacter sp. SP1R1]MBB6149074.1 polysaccharide export outer membrane protein [Mucilaginibacter sp. SP1R1]
MKKNSINYTFILVLLIAVFSSCSSSYKSIPYFQDLERSNTLKENIDNFSPLTIQKEDILGITVSSLNPEAWKDADNKDVGYLVDQNGNIQVPLIGSLKVEGLTTNAIREQIQKKLTVYLKEPSVNVRIMNFKISVIGDVARPDIYKIQNERITITEALGLAGDLNITGIRNNLLLIREIDGKRQYINIDLTSASLFKSPYYYLKNNDVIYVQPDKTKSGSGDRSYRTVSLLLSALSVLTIVLTSVIKN